MACLNSRLAQLWVQPGSVKTQLKLWKICLPQHSNMPKTYVKGVQLQEEKARFCLSSGSSSYPASLAETGKLFPQHREMLKGPRASPCPAVWQVLLDPGSLQQSHWGACAPHSSEQWISRDAAWGAELQFRAFPKSHLNHMMLLGGSRGKDSPLMINQAWEARRPPMSQC